MRVISQPSFGVTLGSLLNDALLGENITFSQVKAAVAYVKRSGVQHIADSLKKFISNGGIAEFVIGIDQGGTTAEGLNLLLEIIEKNGRIFINHDENPYVTFHPKLYLFESLKQAQVFVGSGNLTEGGLFTNDEAFAEILLDKSDKADLTLLKEINDSYNFWSNEKLPTVMQLTPEFLQKLVTAEYVPQESSSDTSEPLDELGDSANFPASGNHHIRKERLFGRTPRLRPARVNRQTPSRSKRTPRSKIEGTIAGIVNVEGFVMSLMRTDVGAGQTTPGANRRSPEIFIPLSARDFNPSFWGWPILFTEDNKRPGKFDRTGVRMRLGGEVINVNMMTWPVKHDFRLRSETLRSAGEIGDLLRLESASAKAGFDYYATIIPQGTEDFAYYSTFCVHTTRNSGKMWGYY